MVRPFNGYPVQRMRRPSAQRGGRAGTLAALLVSAAAAGCGGGGADEPTAAERRQALDRWVASADKACRESNDAIADRGWPANLIDLDRLTVRAIAEVRGASEAIGHLRPPAGSERRVKPFLDSVGRLEPVMEELSSRTEKFKPERLNDVLPKVQSALADVEEQGKELGLRECAANDEHVWVPDAIRAPVFAQQLANLTRQITRRANALDDPVSSQQEAARTLDKLGDIVEDADARLNTFKPPQWASEEAVRYVDALRDLGGAFDDGSTVLSDPDVTLGEINASRRRFLRAGRLEQKRARQLLKEVGAVPVIPGGGGEEETAPGGGESQSA